jgi:Ca2+-binding EF-hand superfamily protein
MSLHKQFLLTCNNLDMITFNDFTKVLKLQRIDLSKSESEKLFENFSTKENLIDNLNEIQLLNFPKFIREFKKVLNSKRLKCIENAFAILDEDSTEMLCIEDLIMKFNIKNHPDLKKKGKSEDEILLEFVDSLDIYCTNLVIFFFLFSYKIFLSFFFL